MWAFLVECMIKKNIENTFFITINYYVYIEKLARMYSMTFGTM